MAFEWLNVIFCGTIMVLIDLVTMPFIVGFSHRTKFVWSGLWYITETKIYNAKIWNPFHASFTVKSVRLMLTRLINMWIDINFCCLCIQNLKIPFKSFNFVRETDIIFLAIFDRGCCLLYVSWLFLIFSCFVYK